MDIIKSQRTVPATIYIEHYHTIIYQCTWA